MTQYQMLISAELLDEIERDDSRLPEGFRIGRVVAQPGGRVGEPASWTSYYVTVEDDDAPPELEGLLVEPVFQAHDDDGSRWVRTTVVSRSVAADATDYVAYVTDVGQRAVQPSGRGEARTVPPYTARPLVKELTK